MALPCAIAQMSNSSPRTMWRNASTRTGTSTKSNAKVRGLTLPSLSAWLLPCVRVTVLSCISHRRLGHAGTGGEGFLRSILEGLVRRQHHRCRAHPVMRRIDTRRDGSFFGQRLGGAHQAMARHDDPIVRRYQILLGAIADRPHAFLQ